MQRTVLLIGATGRLGRHFATALRAERHAVTALVRPQAEGSASSRNGQIDRLRQQGVTLIEGSLEDTAVLERVLGDVDAVVSCIDHRPDHLKLQASLAALAARYPRITRIMPSQFGIDSRLYGEARVEHGDVKRGLQAVFEQGGVPYTFVHTNGLASEWVGSLGQLGLAEPPAEEVELYGSGAVPFSMVAMEDAARYAARALFDERARNRHVAIIPPENVVPQRTLIETWERKTGRALRRIPVSAAALDKRIRALATDPAQRPRFAMAQLVRAAWFDGLGDGRRLPDVQELTALYPDIAYCRIPAYLDRYLDR